MPSVLSCGATWVYFYHGCGVGIGHSQHAGQVIVADDTAEAAARLGHVLTTNPFKGIIRHVDAVYDEAVTVAQQHNIHVQMMD